MFHDLDGFRILIMRATTSGIWGGVNSVWRETLVDLQFPTKLGSVWPPGAQLPGVVMRCLATA